jgi:NADH dehydrogenase
LLVGRLTALGLRVRVMTRDPKRAQHLAGENVEIVVGDLRDSGAVGRAMTGVQVVVNAAQGGFRASGGSTPASVDGEGSSQLIAAAQANGVEHFVLLSIYDVRADHPLELWRMKYLAEEQLKASGLRWTIVRSTAFMEWGAGAVGAPLLKTGKTLVYGRGNNPINFVSAHDVARLVELAITDSTMRGRTVTIAGPDNLTFNQVAETFQTVTGRTGTVNHLPLAVMVMMSKLMRLFNPAMGREIGAGVFLDTADRTVDGPSIRAQYPSIPITSLTDLILRDYGDHVQARNANSANASAASSFRSA